MGRGEAEDIGVGVRLEPVRPVQGADEPHAARGKVGGEPCPQLVELPVVAADQHERGAVVEQRLDGLDQDVDSFQAVDPPEEQQQWLAGT